MWSLFGRELHSNITDGLLDALAQLTSERELIVVRVCARY